MTNLNWHQVSINLTIHQDNSDYRVFFPFDTLNDDVDEVVGELVKTCNLTDEEGQEIKQMIEEQLRQAMGQLPPPALTRDSVSPLNTQINYDSDDEDVANDPEYKVLIAQQKRTLADIEARHQQEQKDLIARIQRGDHPQIPQVCDDLIIFG